MQKITYEIWHLHGKVRKHFRPKEDSIGTIMMMDMLISSLNYFKGLDLELLEPK